LLVGPPLTLEELLAELDDDEQPEDADEHDGENDVTG